MCHLPKYKVFPLRPCEAIYLNPVALRKAKIVYNFGLSEFKGLKETLLQDHQVFTLIYSAAKEVGLVLSKITLNYPRNEHFLERKFATSTCYHSNLFLDHIPCLGYY